MHVFQAGEDHDAVGQTGLHQEVEGVPGREEDEEIFESQPHDWLSGGQGVYQGDRHPKGSGFDRPHLGTLEQHN